MANKKQDNRVQPRIKNKGVIVDLFVLWLALTALSCAAINLHISLNKLEPKEEEEEPIHPAKGMVLGKNKLTGIIGEPLILDISLFRIFCLEK